MDESGRVDDTRFVGMAACLAEEERWRTFDGLWRTALAVSHAPYLHMREFTTFRGPFKGWTERQRRKLMTDLLNVVEDVQIRMMSVVLRSADFRRLSEDVQRTYRDPYYFCFQDCVRNMSMAGYQYRAGDLVDVVYSRQDEFSTAFRWMFNRMKRSLDGDQLGQLAFASMEEHPGLQLADLVAYETTHFYHLKETRPGTPVRVPLARLCESPSARGGAFTYVPYWLMQLRTVPDRRAAQVIHNTMWELFDDWYGVLKEIYIDPVATWSLLRQTSKRSARDLESLRAGGQRPKVMFGPHLPRSRRRPWQRGPIRAIRMPNSRSGWDS